MTSDHPQGARMSDADFVTISGDDLMYVESASPTASNLAELVVHRVRLR